MAGVYVVTGKLGGGKTLATVGKIRDALLAGKPVATNLDIRPEKLIGKKSKNARLYRLPDKPTVEDMRQLGSGNTSYDEEKNGIIALDECGTWFNARGWQDPDRKELINWLLHARKLGWDLFLIIQDISMLDKQARKSVAEHVVYCRRLDKMKYPVIDSLYRLYFGREIPKAKMHLGIVKYGDLPTSITVDRWWYNGRDLYPAYNTKQMFLDDYPHGLYQVLPPYYSHGRYAVKWTGRNLMRMTKVYFKRFSKVLILAFGIFGGAAVASFFGSNNAVTVVSEPDGDHGVQSGTSASDSDLPEDKDIPVTVADRFDGFVLDGVAADSEGNVIYVSIGNGESRYNVQTLRAQGYVVKMVDQCEVLIMSYDRTQQTRLHTSYCAPSKPAPELPRMTESERYRWKLEQVRAEERAAQRR